MSDDAGAIPSSLAVNILSEIYNPLDAPRFLYHYTHFAGLHAIVESKRLWASYSKCLNDASEQVHARRVLHSKFTEVARQLGFDSLGEPMLPLARIFVSCFCESSEILSMWRSYGGDGGGFCIQFPYEALKLLVWPDIDVGYSHPHLSRTYYGEMPPIFTRYFDALLEEARTQNLGLAHIAQWIPPFFP